MKFVFLWLPAILFLGFVGYVVSQDTEHKRRDEPVAERNVGPDTAIHKKLDLILKEVRAIHEHLHPTGSTGAVKP